MQCICIKNQYNKDTVCCLRGRMSLTVKRELCWCLTKQKTQGACYRFGMSSWDTNAIFSVHRPLLTQYRKLNIIKRVLRHEALQGPSDFSFFVSIIIMSFMLDTQTPTRGELVLFLLLGAETVHCMQATHRSTGHSVRNASD